ncbi:pepsin/retropepsin-like aspartic protease family protein [Brevundimonas sp.]|uniref:pepsin/retropepsin-like aspartic protease family protein n=1 Tax=Brevundimonas sp. TaxID=1871086 RepID=UPI002D526977|nr:pepsin/retropepsin-like aspartic protease family protein [Brevundimonas sp.]HYC98976.1 pepsin/retropepsin-like aspartic protease family protein [Brevundimonas sp.]
MNRRNFLIRTAGLAAVVGAAWWARETLLWPAPKLIFAGGGATPWLPYARRANVPTVRVRVAGREVIALIDTGAQYSVIDRALVEALPAQQRSIFEMPLVAYGVGGGTQMGRGTTVEVTLPGLTIGKLRAAILDLGPLASAGGLNTPLILGRDILEHLVLALDPARRHVRLIRREVFARPPDLAAAVVRRSSGGLIAEVTVEGVAVDAVIDTGASSLLALDKATAQATGLLDGRPQQVGTSLVLGGAMRAAVVEARTVTFADHLYRRVQVGVFDQPPLPNFPGALVGMEAFAARRAAFDLGAGTLHLSRPLDLTVG